MTWPFGSLTPLSYDFIMADPAWEFEHWSEKGHGKSAQEQYECMSLHEIKALPVDHLAARDCILWLWCTNPMLPQQIQVMEAWNFKYVTAGTWVKKTVHGKTAFGTGKTLRCSSEPFIIGSFGKPKYAHTERTSFEAQIREHSRKPDEAFEIAERLWPNALKRLELFSRQRRPGWDVWGNEVDKFTEAA